MSHTLENPVAAEAPVAVDWGERLFWPGVATLVVIASAFLAHQLLAWPPHEDETLALFIGRDSLPGLIEHVTRDRGGAPLHFLVAWSVAHLGFGLGGLRAMSAVFAVGSLPLVALLGRRLFGRVAALVGTTLFAGSWLFLFHGIYGRMYSLFLFLSLLSVLAVLRALERGNRRAWAIWIAAGLACVAAHPYGVLVLGGQGLYVLWERRDRLREAVLAGATLLVLGVPFWLTDLVLAGRFDVGVGGGGAKLGGPTAVARYLWSVEEDATAGWHWVALTLALVALVGLVRARRDTRRLLIAMAAAPIVAFLTAKLGGATAPESRHLISLAPFVSLCLANGLAQATRRFRPALPVLVALIVVLEVSWAWHRTAPLFTWEPDQRQAARAEASAWLATTSRPSDILFGYDPLFLGAWERNADFSRIVIPRADAVLALRVLERHTPVGRGVWVFDASKRNNVKARLEIDRVTPTPTVLFQAKAFGPFLVIRTRRDTLTPEAYLYAATRAMLVGRSLGIGDTDINLATVETASRTLRGYGPSLRDRSPGSR